VPDKAAAAEHTLCMVKADNEVWHKSGRKDLKGFIEDQYKILNAEENAYGSRENYLRQ
jgi:hypothetical protein